MTEARILIVEDIIIVATDLRFSLENMGYTVCGVATSGEKAIQMAEELSPDLVLMDVVLQGGMDGIQAAETIRNNLDVPVIYLTAYADSEILERAKTTEPSGYMIKPFRERELQIAIEFSLYKHSAEKERKALVEELQKALADVEKLSGLLPICSACKRIRDGSGQWQQIETYIRERSNADFSHTICPACARRLYPDYCDSQ